jgi:serine/threonine protein kinase
VPLTCEETDSLLLDFADGDLDHEQSDHVRRHVRECAECAARLRALRDLVGAMSVARSMTGRAAVSDTQLHRTVSGDTVKLPQDLKACVLALADYEVLAELGRGGMGVVYRARQISLNRVVALKVLSSAITASPSAIMRFRKEAQAAARLHHTNIVPVYAQGQEGDCFYYTMELVDGQPLSQVLDEAPSLVGGAVAPLDSAAPDPALEAHHSITLSRAMPRRTRDYKRIAAMLAGVAEGLHHAHEQGIIHRDIKPQNLLLGRDGQLHITDFGLARLLDEPGVTLSTEMVGTPAYMSPEQISGRPISRASDVFSLGGVMYEMLVHRRAFEGRTYDQVIHNVLRTEPRRPRKFDPHVPVDLETICLRALEKDPARRFASAADIARDLRRYAEDFPITSRRIGPVGRTVRWMRRHPARTAAISAIALLLLVAPFAFASARSLRAERIASAKKAIDSALDKLLGDMRDPDALAILQPALASGVEPARAHFVEAAAWVLNDPKKCVSVLLPLASAPDADSDIHYLLAWAYRRRGLEGDAGLCASALLAGQRCGNPSAAGFFFRGMALSATDPEAAIVAFEDAKNGRDRFTQAMLQQARAYNQTLYYMRDLTKYDLACKNLEALVELQPRDAHPRYLLAAAHRVAAEVYTERARDKKSDDLYSREQQKKADEAYSQCDAAAIAAKKNGPSNPRGYAAKAEYYESVATVDPEAPAERRQTLFRDALAEWVEQANPNNAVLMRVTDWAEQCAYRMRLEYWLGEFDAAAASNAQLCTPKCGYNPAKDPYMPEQMLFGVLFALGANDAALARSILAAADAYCGKAGEAHLLRRALLEYTSGATPDPASAERFDKPTSPSWTEAWLDVLLRYQSNLATWENVERAAREISVEKIDIQRRMAGAWLIRGLKALAGGKRDEALTAFWNGAQQRDNEHYCFAAKMLYFGLLDGRLPISIAKSDR